MPSVALTPLRCVGCVALFLAHTAAADDRASSADKSRFTIFNPTPRELRRPYITDRASKTDSPYTIDAGAFQIETDLAGWTLDERNPAHAEIRVRTWSAGQTNFKIGLTNWADLQFVPQGYVARRTSGRDAGPAVTQSGFGDTTIRLKVNFVGNDGGPFVAALVSSLKLSTNTGYVANNAYEPGFALPINYALPGGFTLFAQARIDVLDEPQSASRRVQWSSPIGVSRNIVGKLSGYAEFYSAFSSGRDHPWIGTADFGLVYQVTPEVSVDINSFIGLTPSADDLNVFVGFARRF